MSLVFLDRIYDHSNTVNLSYWSFKVMIRLSAIRNLRLKKEYPLNDSFYAILRQCTDFDNFSWALLWKGSVKPPLQH